jgi:hypothetical protein
MMTLELSAVQTQLVNERHTYIFVVVIHLCMYMCMYVYIYIYRHMFVLLD